MARQGIGTGSSPNDGTGDNLRVAGGKINDNFSELYTHFGDGTDLTAIVGTGIATASGLVGTGATILDFRGSAISEVTVGSGIATINVTGGSSGGSSYTDFDVNAHLNVSSAQANEVLRWTGTDYDWVAQASGGGGGGSNLSDFSVTTNSVGTAALSYNNTSGVFTYTPPDLSSYLTSESDTLSDVVSRGSSAGGSINFDASQAITFATASNNNFEIYGSSNQKAYIVHAQDNGGGGAGDLAVIAKNGFHVYGGTSELSQYKGLEVSSGDVKLQYQGNTKLQTNATGVSITGNASLGNNDQIKLGSGDLMKMYYSSSGDVGAFVESHNNDLHLVGSTNGGVRIITYNKDSLVANYNSSVDLYHNGSKKFETTSTGITVTGDIELSGSILSSYTGSTETYAVTTGSKTSAHRYNGTGSGSGYFIDGVEAPFLTLTPGKTYRFTNDNTGSHPLKFYLEADKTTEYTTGVTFDNTYTEITVSDTTPQVLHYQCTNHAYMGNAVYTNANKVQTPYSASVGAGTSTNGIESPALTLSHNNPTVAGTSGTTGQFKQIGGAPFFYDGALWREFVLATGTPVTRREDSDWDDVILRLDFEDDTTNIGEIENIKVIGGGLDQSPDNVETTTVDLVGSPVKYGSKALRFSGDTGNFPFAWTNRTTNTNDKLFDFTGGWTIEMWLYMPSLPSLGEINPIISETEVSNSPTKDWGLFLMLNAGSTYAFHWYNVNNGDSTTASTPGNIVGTIDSTSLLNQWNHIALVRDPDDSSLHFFINGTEAIQTNGSTGLTRTDTNLAWGGTSSYLSFGYHYRVANSTDHYTNMIIDDVRISTSARYTSNFTAPTAALPIAGTASTIYTPPGSKQGEIALGSSPTWTGTTGVTASQVASGQYRLTFSSSYVGGTSGYIVNANTMDYDPAESIVGVGVSRVSGSVCDFFVRRLSDSSAVDTGSLAVNVYKK